MAVQYTHCGVNWTPRWSISSIANQARKHELKIIKFNQTPIKLSKWRLKIIKLDCNFIKFYYIQSPFCPSILIFQNLAKNDVIIHVLLFNVTDRIARVNSSVHKEKHEIRC